MTLGLLRRPLPYFYVEKKMPVYIKPNGTEIEINEASVDFAESLGWKKKAAPKKKPVAKKKVK